MLSTLGPGPSADLPSQRAAEHLKRKIAAILAADVAGYSRLVAADEEGTLRALEAARTVFDARVRRGGGRIFNTAGDSVMCEFDSAVEAVRAAIDIQAELAAGNAAVPAGRRLEFRIGITIGDVVERGSDLLGDGVNIAARLEALSQPGGVCVSRSVHEAVANKVPVAFRELGARRVKNMPQPLHAYLIAPPEGRVGQVEPSEGDGRVGQPKRGTRVGTGRRRWLIAGAVVVGLLGLPVLRSAWDSLDAARTSIEQGSAGPSGGMAGEGRTAAGSGTDGRPALGPSPETVGRAAPVDLTPPPRPFAEPRMAPADAASVFRSLAREGVVADAKTLPDLYHNARVHESQGNRQAALRAYEAAAPLAGEAVDVHMRYAAALRAASGPAAARAAYAALARTVPSRAVNLVAALQAEPAERQARVESILSQSPDYGPAAFALAEALGAEKGGAGPTLTERRLAFDSLERFLESAAADPTKALFVDRAFLEAWRESARRRRNEIEALFVGAATRPRATFARAGSGGWVARLTLPEPATEILTRLGDKGEFASTGLTRADDPRTGKPAPNTAVELPAGSGRTTLYVAYRDRSGREAGPFPLSFDPAVATVESGREALERFPESWVSFRTDLPDLLSYAGLVGNRCAIARATIRFGDASPPEALPLPPCDASGPAALPSGAGTVMTLPGGVDAVQVQLTYADGSESPVRTFRRP